MARPFGVVVGRGCLGAVDSLAASGNPAVGAMDERVWSAVSGRFGDRLPILGALTTHGPAVTICSPIERQSWGIHRCMPSGAQHTPPLFP